MRKMFFFILDMLLHFETRTTQRRWGRKFLTFNPCKIRGGMDEMSW